MVILLQSHLNITLSILLILLLGHADFKMNRKKITTRLFFTWWKRGKDLYFTLDSNTRPTFLKKVGSF
ncbi:hypothetical protein B1NLA3E_07410 [Bacillus sp. 1NLA3E]|nr:hypothetical protein B1NLA3E_07410 [Bacillus sp. 1NLA3E]